jgi:antirestriction protein ArdC
LAHLSRDCADSAPSRPIGQGSVAHAGYIQSWIGLLKADSRAFFTACKAQAAADYLRGHALRDGQPAMAAPNANRKMGFMGVLP